MCVSKRLKRRRFKRMRGRSLLSPFHGPRILPKTSETLDTFASEQTSRLVAMDRATPNNERLTGSLIDLEQRERHDGDGECLGQMLNLS